MKKLTLADIAKKTGYSVNTVSHALRDMKDISEGVKSYINDTAKKMGYIPNIAAGALRNGKTLNIAFVTDDISFPRNALFAKELELSLKKSGYSLIVINTNADKKLEHDAFVSAISKNVDAIIISSPQISSSDIEFIRESGIPYIFLNSGNDFFVSENYIESGYLLGRFIASFGHRKVLLLSEDYDASGIIKALDEVSGKITEDGSPILKALDKNTDCSCIICTDICQAFSVYSIFHKAGKSIPEDISVAVLESKDVESPFNFTSAGASLTEKAQNVTRLLSGLINNEEVETKITLPSYLSEGETVKEPARRFVARKALSDYLL